MFTSLIGWIKFLSALYSFLQWVIGKISLAQHTATLKSIDAVIGRAEAGDLPDRMEGGADVEDKFNNRR